MNTETPITASVPESARRFAVLALASTIAACSGETTSVAWSLGGDNSVLSPESAYFDADSGLLFVSQIGEGGGTTRDGDGWISKLNTDGEVLEPRWVGGLNAPKGMRSHDGTLWVADIDRLVAIRIADGAITAEVAVAGAQFLNDVVCADDGSVYVSDMLTSRIHHYKDDRLSVFAEGREMENPNGLLIDGGKLIVASWGLDMRHDLSTAVPGRVYAIDLDTRERTNLTEPLGNLDGIEADGSGGYLVTDWVAGKVYRIRDGQAQTLMSLPKGAADIAFLPGSNRLIVPRMLENRLTAFDLGADF